MGIGTVAFEARFARQLTALRADSVVAGLIAGTYVHEMLGVGFELPPGWFIRDLQEVARTAEGRLLSSHEDDWNEAFRSLTDEFLPIVTISAPTLDDPIARLGPHEISPVAVLQLEEIVPDESAADFDLFGHVATDLAYFHGHVEDFRLTSEPVRTTLSACEAVRYTAAYTVLHADAIEGCPTRERTYYVRHHGAVFALRLCDYPDRDPRLGFDFDSFVGTVAFR